MNFSAFKKEIIIGLISFIFGGVLAAIFQGFLDRPKPQISVKDISFDNNSEKFIEATSNYLSKNDDIIQFNKYMTYKEILTQEQVIGNILSKLKGLKTDLTQWKEQNLSEGTGSQSHVNLNSFPIFDNNDYSNLFIISTHKINPNDLPTKLEELKKSKSLFEAGVEKTTNFLLP